MTFALVKFIFALALILVISMYVFSLNDDYKRTKLDAKRKGNTTLASRIEKVYLLKIAVSTLVIIVIVVCLVPSQLI